MAIRSSYEACLVARVYALRALLCQKHNDQVGAERWKHRSTEVAQEAARLSSTSAEDRWHVQQAWAANDWAHRTQKRQAAQAA